MLSTTINSDTDVEKEKVLNEQAFDLFRNHESTVLPRFPLVMVRVLPRDQLTEGGIVLPGGKQQNKPVYEGIVLRTWAPRFIAKDQALNKWEEGLDNSKDQSLESEFEMGDHIIFEHWAGFPVPGLHESFYRMVPEFMNAKRENGPILGKLIYQRENSTEKLKDLLTAFGSAVYLNPQIADSISGPAVLETLLVKAVENIKENFDFVRKINQSRTISGS